jgi:hypothetical protein
MSLEMNIDGDGRVREKYRERSYTFF